MPSSQVVGGMKTKAIEIIWGKNGVLTLKEPQSQPPPCTQILDLAIPDENPQKTGSGQLRSAPVRAWGSRQVSQHDLRQHSPSVFMSKFGESPTEGKMFHIYKL